MAHTQNAITWRKENQEFHESSGNECSDTLTKKVTKKIKQTKNLTDGHTSKHTSQSVVKYKISNAPNINCATLSLPISLSLSLSLTHTHTQ
jgi:chloramphenicol O-acetyltransferase